MPSRELHNFVNRLLLGRDYDEVNALVDFPYKFLGRRHRVLMHDLKLTPFTIAMLTRNHKKGLAAAVHIILDKAVSKGVIDKKLLKLLSTYY